MKKKKIAIGFFGISRSLKWTAPSIYKHIIIPIRSIYDLKIFGHFYKIKFIKNKRSGENQALDPDDHKNLKFDELVIQNPTAVLNGANYSNILSYGDAWQDDGKSLSNLIYQLSSLKMLAKMIIKQKPDVVILLRPDLYYHDSFLNTVKLQLEMPSFYASIPEWQWFGGLNDRFAVLGYEAFLVYANRLDYVFEFLEKKQKSLHSEKFLWHTLVHHGIHITPTKIRASRIRVNGYSVLENFKGLSFSKLIRYKFFNFANKIKRLFFMGRS
jgi:hypothetical protein